MKSIVDKILKESELPVNTQSKLDFTTEESNILKDKTKLVPYNLLLKVKRRKNFASSVRNIPKDVRVYLRGEEAIMDMADGWAVNNVWESEEGAVDDLFAGRTILMPDGTQVFLEDSWDASDFIWNAKPIRKKK